MNNRKPHDGVYTRLKPSPIHGIGVFAIRRIPKATSIFEGDEPIMFSIHESELEGLPKEIRRLYEDFAIIDEDRMYWCPQNFNVLTIGWYINNSFSPNVYYDSNIDNFISLRDIEVGEELTANYDDYSERPCRID